MSEVFSEKNKKQDSLHIKKWYKENYGVDPIKLKLPFKEVKNPYFSSAAPMKLWDEKDVLPFKNEAGIKRYSERSNAGKKAFKTRKIRMIEWFKQVKSGKPRVLEITRRLWEIGEQINQLHHLKEECRNTDPTYDPHEFWEFGSEHCEDCKEKSDEQWNLREEREELFGELEVVCSADKRTIQVARKYYRNEEVDKK
ncbi:hypothetical protein KAW18_02445 [candidate division WOR-3 bacterium]|nr:hypothetical protein [candidate division WOR-3 bacterium]